MVIGNDGFIRALSTVRSLVLQRDLAIADGDIDEALQCARLIVHARIHAGANYMRFCALNWSILRAQPHYKMTVNVRAEMRATGAKHGGW